MPKQANVHPAQNKFPISKAKAHSTQTTDSITANSAKGSKRDN